jgi:Domain of unknown function (DUF4287)/Domain of unknown function (DUF5655)
VPFTPNQMGDAVIRNLPAKTGRTIDEWVALVGQSGLSGHRARVEWLKREHALGHVTAEIVVGTAETPEGWAPESPETLVERQYAGPKASLRPIYERIAQVVGDFGPDVILDPRQSYVAVRREAAFALVQPSARNRVDLGLVLPGVEPTSRLRPAGSFGTGSTTHRVALASPVDVDAEVTGWLRMAYVGRANR